MSRLLIGALVAIVLVAGAVWLSRIDATKPLKHVEKTVPVDASQR